MSRDPVNELDTKIRHLRAELDGLRGAVLRENDMPAYLRKQQELQDAIREYYSTLYGDRVSMP